jgi:hypothetical protein
MDFTEIFEVLPHCHDLPAIMMVGAVGLGFLLIIDRAGETRPLAPWRAGDAPRRPHLERQKKRQWNIAYGAATGAIIGIVLSLHPCG